MTARGITPEVCKWRESPPTISPSLEPAERQCSQASQVGEVLQGAGFAVGEREAGSGKGEWKKEETKG